MLLKKSLKVLLTCCISIGLVSCSNEQADRDSYDNYIDQKLYEACVEAYPDDYDVRC